MGDDLLKNSERILGLIQTLARTKSLRVTQHAQQEMVEEDIALDDVLQAIQLGQILENYPG